MISFLHSLSHFMGTDNPSGFWYLLWSGFSNNIRDIFLGFGAFAIISRHNCHRHHCWRIGRFPVQDSHHFYCKKHHPNIDDHYESAAKVSRGEDV